MQRLSNLGSLVVIERLSVVSFSFMRETQEYITYIRIEVFFHTTFIHIKGGYCMTVQQDMQKAVAAAQSALGTYATFSESTQDQSAKQMFKDMTVEMQKHVAMLNSRLGYLTQNNDLNQKPQA